MYGERNNDKTKQANKPPPYTGIKIITEPQVCWAKLDTLHALLFASSNQVVQLEHNVLCSTSS